MTVDLCYENASVEIKWTLPFFPRTGEYISTTELLSEEQANQLSAKRDYFKIINISWFLHEDSSKTVVEILLK